MDPFDNLTSLTGQQCFHYHTYEKKILPYAHIDLTQTKALFFVLLLLCLFFFFFTCTKISSDLKAVASDQWHIEWSACADMKDMTTPQSLLPCCSVSVVPQSKHTTNWEKLGNESQICTVIFANLQQPAAFISVTTGAIQSHIVLRQFIPSLLFCFICQL